MRFRLLQIIVRKTKDNSDRNKAYKLLQDTLEKQSYLNEKGDINNFVKYVTGLLSYVEHDTLTIHALNMWDDYEVSIEKRTALLLEARHAISVKGIDPNPRIEEKIHMTSPQTVDKVEALSWSITSASFREKNHVPNNNNNVITSLPEPSAPPHEEMHACSNDNNFVESLNEEIKKSIISCVNSSIEDLENADFNVRQILYALRSFLDNSNSEDVKQWRNIILDNCNLETYLKNPTIMDTLIKPSQHEEAIFFLKEMIREKTEALMDTALEKRPTRPECKDVGVQVTPNEENELETQVESQEYKNADLLTTFSGTRTSPEDKSADLQPSSHDTLHGEPRLD